MLSRWPEFWFESQNFCGWGDAPGQAAADDADYVFTDAETEQPIFGELLAGHAIECLLVHIPGPNQHLVGDIFISGVAVSFLF